MERTSRGKFEGGDADWEEKKLRSYSNSEVRLVEIQEKLCSDVSKGEDQVQNSTKKLFFCKYLFNFALILFYSVITWLKLMNP